MVSKYENIIWNIFFMKNISRCVLEVSSLFFAFCIYLYTHTHTHTHVYNLITLHENFFENSESVVPCRRCGNYKSSATVYARIRTIRSTWRWQIHGPWHGSFITFLLNIWMHAPSFLSIYWAIHLSVFDPRPTSHYRKMRKIYQVPPRLRYSVYR